MLFVINPVGILLYSKTVGTILMTFSGNIEISPASDPVSLIAIGSTDYFLVSGYR